MDLISKKAAVSRISDLLILELKGERIPTWNEVYNAIGDIPTIETEPVKHGRWIVPNECKTTEQYRCSVCGSNVHVPECIGEPTFRYCPDCGARMEDVE